MPYDLRIASIPWRYVGELNQAISGSSEDEILERKQGEWESYSLNLTFVQEFGLLREERAFWHRLSAMPRDHYFDTVGSIGHSSGEVPKLN